MSVKNVGDPVSRWKWHTGILESNFSNKRGCSLIDFDGTDLCVWAGMESGTEGLQREAVRVFLGLFFRRGEDCTCLFVVDTVGSSSSHVGSGHSCLANE